MHFMERIHEYSLEGDITLVRGMTLKDVAAVFRNRLFVKRMIRDGKLVPLIQGGKGRSAIFDPADVKTLWDDLKKEAR